MEVKINREIRSYSESVFFGLSPRQFFCSLGAACAAVLTYFLARGLGTEAVSWLCVLAAAPFALAGFLTVHGMTAERFALAWLRSEVLEPKVLVSRPSNLYMEALGLDGKDGAA